MSDRELLEKAARAAGITLKPMQINNVSKQGDNRFIGYLADVGQWPRGWFKPLTDDGDALRLAVKLRLGIVHGWESFEEQPLATVWISHDGQCLAEEVKGDDPYAATRRAIVRAAAALGETK